MGSKRGGVHSVHGRLSYTRDRHLVTPGNSRQVGGRCRSGILVSVLRMGTFSSDGFYIFSYPLLGTETMGGRIDENFREET